MKTLPSELRGRSLLEQWQQTQRGLYPLVLSELNEVQLDSYPVKDAPADVRRIFYRAAAGKPLQEALVIIPPRITEIVVEEYQPDWERFWQEPTMAGRKSTMIQIGF